MNVGSSRGSGGGGLAGHWLKAKNEAVRPLPARGIGARGDLKAQVAALTAETAHATFAKPVAHFWFPPNPADRMPTAAEKADLLARIEREFRLAHQPRIGCVHVLRRDMDAAGTERHPAWGGVDEHEHYAWSLVREDGRAVDHMRQSWIRQQRVVAEWQHAHGLRITPMKHVTAVLAHLDRHNPEAAAAVRAAGMRSLDEPHPSPVHIATYRTQERAQMERNPAVPVAGKTRHAFNTRRDVLGAWRASDDGGAFAAALAERSYRLAQGTRSALIVDPAGIEHRATELLGTAGRKLEGRAVAAAEVHARLAGLDLAPIGQARQAMRARDAKAPAARPPAHPGFAYAPQAAAPVPEADAAPEGAAGPARERGGAVPMVPVPAPQPIAEPEPAGFVPAGDTQSAPSARAEPAAPTDGAGAPRVGPVIGGSGGGLAAGGGGGDFDSVEPIDPNKPGDAIRYARQVAAMWERRARPSPRPDDRASRDAQGTAAEAAARFGESIRAFLEGAAEERARYPEERRESNVGSEQGQAAHHGPGDTDPVGDDAPGRGAAAVEQLRPQGADAGHLRSPVHGPRRPRPAGPEAATGSAPGGRAEPDGSGDRAPGADREQPGEDGRGAGSPGAAAAADRLRARREAKGFADAAGRHAGRLRWLTERLASTPERIAGQERRGRIEDALAASRARIAVVLATAPHPDPASRDPELLAQEERQRVEAHLQKARAEAGAAWQAAVAARGRLGILGRLGLPTAARREAGALEAAARDAERRAGAAAESHVRALRDADRCAAARAAVRDADQGRWERRPEVQAARREARGNALVAEAIEVGDQGIERLAAEGLGQARAEVFRREERECREQKRRARRALERAEVAKAEFEHTGDPREPGSDGAPATAPGARMR